MSTNLCPEVLPPRRPRGLAAAALAAALGGAIGAATVGGAAWYAFGDHAPMQAPAAAIPSAPLGEPAVPVAAPEPAPESAPESAVAAIAPAALRGTAALIVHGDGPMISLAAAEPEWQTGVPTMLDHDDYSRTLSRQVSDAVPASYRAVVGKTIIAIDSEGRRCQAIAGELSVVGTYYSELDEPETQTELVEAWDYTSPALTAAIQVPDSCGDLTWAIIPDGDVAAELDAAPVLTEPAVAPALLERFRATPRWAAIQSEVATYEDNVIWDENATRLTATIGGDDGVAIAAAVSYPCESGGELTALWHLRDGEIGGRIALPSDVVLSEIVAAADLNGDGLPEIVYRNARLQTGVLVSRDGAYTNVPGPEIMSHICPC